MLQKQTTPKVYFLLLACVYFRLSVRKKSQERPAVLELHHLKPQPLHLWGRGEIRLKRLYVGCACFHPEGKPAIPPHSEGGHSTVFPCLTRGQLGQMGPPETLLSNTVGPTLLSLGY